MIASFVYMYILPQTVSNTHDITNLEYNDKFDFIISDMHDCLDDDITVCYINWKLRKEIIARKSACFQPVVKLGRAFLRRQ